MVCTDKMSSNRREPVWKVLIKMNIFRLKINEKLEFPEKVDKEIFFVNETLDENKLGDDG